MCSRAQVQRAILVQVHRHLLLRGTDGVHPPWQTSWQTAVHPDFLFTCRSLFPALFVSPVLAAGGLWISR